MQACIRLSELGVEEVDNGRGTQPPSPESCPDSFALPVAPVRLTTLNVILKTNSNVGLQCHTAPFSWKLVFECDHQLFEVTMSACSPKEELEWRSRLADHSCRETLDAGEQVLFTSISLGIKPMGTVFGKPG